MPDTTSSHAFIQGWLMTAGLIVAIGAQNACVLRQGLARTHVGAVVALCTVSDWLLIALGVFGAGAVIRSSPLLLEVFRYGGALFLIAYGLRSLHKAWRGADQSLAPISGASSLGRTVVSLLALTYLNPHVYLDTVVLLGSVGAQHPPAGQVGFALGAGLASSMWFASLGYGAAWAARGLQRPGVWRAIDLSIALVMFVVAAQLLLNPLNPGGPAV